MKFELDIDEAEIKELVKNRIAENIMGHLWDASDIDDWDARKRVSKKRRETIIKSIAWDTAPKEMTSIVVQKFFSRLMSRDD